MFLTNTELFGKLYKEEMLSIFEDSKYKIKEYQKDQIIHIQNEVCDYLDVIMMGCITVKKIDENGRVLQVGDFPVLEIIGANLIFSSKNVYPMMVTAKCDTTMMHIHKDTILRLCQNNNEFMLELMRTISDKVAVLTNKINQISLKTIRMKIIEFLMYESYLQNSNVIKLKISKTQLAERFGIPRPSLSRELNKMRKDGMIEFDAKTITIKNIGNSKFRAE